MMPATLDGEGVEVNGRQKGWWYAGGLINSGRTFGKPTDKSLNNLENVYGWLMREVGPHYVTVRVYLDHQDPIVLGKSSSLHTQVDASAMLNVSRLVLIPALTYQKFEDAPGADHSQSGMLEATWLIDTPGWWVLTGRYEIEHVPESSLTAEEDHTLEVLNIAHFVNRNARIALEWAHTGDNVQGPRVNSVNAYVQVGY
jgi:hypothetical protein